MFELGEKKTNAFGDTYYQGCGLSKLKNTPYEWVFERHFAPKIQAKRTLYIIVGTDSGLLYDKVGHEKYKHGNHYIFIEHQAIIEALALTDQEHITVLTDPSVLNQMLFEEACIDYVFSNRVFVLASCGSLLADSSAWHQSLFKEVKQSVDALLKPVFSSFRSFYYENCRLLNLAENQVPVSKMTGAFHGQPVVLIAGGPTLDDAIDWIKQYQSQVFVAAVGRVCQRLYKENITPDLVVTVDPFAFSFDNAKGLFHFQKSSVLIQAFHAVPKLVSQWSGSQFYVGERLAWAKDFDANVSVVGPTVTNTALEVLLHLGFSQLYLAGVDFCYVNNKTHESKSDEARFSAASVGKQYVTVENYLGDNVLTDQAYKESYHRFQTQLKPFLTKVSVVSLSTQSAKLEGADVIDANRHHPKADKTPLLKQIKQWGQMPCRPLTKRLDQDVRRVKDQIHRFRQVMQLSKKALSVLKKVIEDGQITRRDHKQINQYKKRIEKKIGEDGHFVFHYNAAFFSGFFSAYVGVEAQSKAAPSSQEAYASLRQFFYGIDQFASRYSSVLRQAQQRLQQKRDEIGAKKPAHVLFEQWQADEEWGRAQHYGLCREADSIADNTQESDVVEQALKQFEAEIGHTQTHASKIVQSRVLSFKKGFNRLTQRFKEQKLEALEALHDDLMANNADQGLIHLATGLICELKQAYAQALIAYQHIIEPRMLFYVLQRKFEVYLRLDKPTEALNTLKALTKYDFSYWVSYADLVYAYGKHEDAINVLEHYLQRVPKDIGTRLKVAGWCFRHAYGERAKAHLKLVLELEPDNPSAAQLMAQCDSPPAN